MCTVTPKEVHHMADTICQRHGIDQEKIVQKLLMVGNTCCIDLISITNTKG
jgi:hypothetical protein